MEIHSLKRHILIHSEMKKHFSFLSFISNMKTVNLKNKFYIYSLVFVFGLLTATPTYGFALEGDTENIVVENITVTTEEGEEISDNLILTDTNTSTNDNTTTTTIDLSFVIDTDSSSTTSLTTTTSLIMITDPTTTTTTDELNISTSTSTSTSTTTGSSTTPLTETATGGQSETTQTNTPPPQTISQTQISDVVNKILNYFKTQQSPDGKIVDGTITDWAIMSFGANNQYAEEIKNTGTSLLDYEKKYNLDDPSDINSCATYPRHILALIAAGVGANDSSIKGLKEKMSTICHKDNLYGLSGTNDDVFALLALLATGESAQNPLVISTINTIVSDQTADGSFTWAGYQSADITGASINALKYAQNKGAEINSEIFAKAKSYLKSTQQNDGGWGYGTSEIMTTSWVIMGINALNEGQNDWITASGTNPWSPLINQLKTDNNTNGYYESIWSPGTTDWFAMKHAVPALAGKSWPIILSEKVQNFSQGATFTYGSSSGYTPPTITPTTTFTTTTIAITITTTTTTTTSTIEIIGPKTTEPPLLNTPTTTIAINTATINIQKKHIPIKLKILNNKKQYEKISTSNITNNSWSGYPFRTSSTKFYGNRSSCVFCWPIFTK